MAGTTSHIASRAAMRRVHDEFAMRQVFGLDVGAQEGEPRGTGLCLCLGLTVNDAAKESHEYNDHDRTNAFCSEGDEGD